LNDLASAIESNVAAALAEDIGSGDRTAQLIAAGVDAAASVICRSDAVICGAPWFDACFHQLEPKSEIRWLVGEGDKVRAGQELCSVHATSRALLTAERTALNFLQLLSAVATATRHYVDAVAGARAKIVDTRKTLPGLRMAEKYGTHGRRRQPP
jgi:nicotinate-nucleotide pyrophosphorylase (carboxylating)